MGLEKLPFPLSFVIMYGTLCNCNELSNQYSASHEAYEIQVTSLTRSLAQMEEQLRLANEDRVSGFQDISLFMATDLGFRFSLYNKRFGGHIPIHSHNLYTQSQGVLLTPASDRGSQRSCSSAVIWVSFTFFFFFFFKVSRDRRPKRAWSDFTW